MTMTVLPPRSAPSPGLAGLLRLDPLAPLIAILAPIVTISASRTWEVGAVSICVLAPFLIVIQPRRGAWAALGILTFTAFLTLGFASTTEIGPEHGHAIITRLPLFSPAQWDRALNFTARVGAILCLLLAAGLLSNPEDTVRAFVVHLKMPNRIAQVGIATFGFVDVLRREQRSILEAHILRGSALDAPLLGPTIRWFRSIPALVAAAVRHAERVSMSMDARAFGAYPTRTERVEFSWRKRDTVFLLLAFATTGLLVHTFWDTGFAFQRTLS